MSKMATSIDDFCADGFLLVRGAFAPEIVRACVDVIDTELRRRAVDPRDPHDLDGAGGTLHLPRGPRVRSRGRLASALGDVRRAARSQPLGEARRGRRNPFRSASPACAIPATRAGTSTAATTWMERGGSMC